MNIHVGPVCKQRNPIWPEYYPVTKALEDPAPFEFWSPLYPHSSFFQCNGKVSIPCNHGFSTLLTALDQRLANQLPSTPKWRLPSLYTLNILPVEKTTLEVCVSPNFQFPTDRYVWVRAKLRIDQIGQYYGYVQREFVKLIELEIQLQPIRCITLLQLCLKRTGWQLPTHVLRAIYTYLRQAWNTDPFIAS